MGGRSARQKKLSGGDRVRQDFETSAVLRAAPASTFRRGAHLCWLTWTAARSLFFSLKFNKKVLPLES